MAFALPVSPLSRISRLPFPRLRWGLALAHSRRRISMPTYEHVFMARQDVSSQQVESLTDQYKAVIEEGGGKIEKVEQWGLKTLAYRIKKNRKAHYTLMNINAPHTAVAEMERQMNLNEDVLRFMTIRMDELEEEPSVMMQRRDRDDRKRRDRGDRGDRDDRPARSFGDREDRAPRRSEEKE